MMKLAIMQASPAYSQAYVLPVKSKCRSHNPALKQSLVSSCWKQYNIAVDNASKGTRS
jgi:hypothetical protein